MALATRLLRCSEKKRVFILTDIANEPDDAQSLVRYLLYCNEFDTRGIVACTSCWMKETVHPEDIEAVIEGYAQVVSVLNTHVHPDNLYPDPGYLTGRVKSGPALYGREALKEDVPLSDGATLLIDEVDASDTPLWILCWGGTNVLAQALQHVQKTRSVEQTLAFCSRLRVYAISDQDDTGLWIRVKFPSVFYICSVHGWGNYRVATWTGMSADIFAPPGEGGPDASKLRDEWIRHNIQIGPLGKMYPDRKFLVEGDTPTFLYLIPNGLGDPEHPAWGSWGGRYVPIDLSLAANHYADTVDTVVGKDGGRYTNNQATIWRWRDAYQNSFAARMQWTLSGDVAKANHAPVVIVNQSSADQRAILLNVEVDTSIELDASASYDPDGDELTFRWYQYLEPSLASGLVEQQLAPIDIQKDGSDGRKVNVVIPPADKCAIEQVSGKAIREGQVFHIILEVQDNGAPSLTTYKRIVIQVINSGLKGGRAYKVETLTDFLELAT